MTWCTVRCPFCILGLVGVWVNPTVFGADQAGPSTTRKAAAPASQPHLHIDKTGTRYGTPIQSGFVFFDGQYINAPYVVSRQGVAIFINDTMVEPPRALPDEATASGETDPPVPLTAGKQTSQYDAATVDYLKRKVAYAHKNLSSDQEREFMEKAIRSLPSTKTASLDPQDRNVLHVTTHNGEEHPYYLLTPRRRGARNSADVVQQLDQYCDHLETLLKRGAGLFFQADGSRTMLSSRDAAHRLSRIARVLRSDKPVDQKFAEVQAAGLPQVTPESFPSIVTHFAASTQLEARLREATSKPVGVPDSPQ
jgi:hypothetical protein